MKSKLNLSDKTPLPASTPGPEPQADVQCTRTGTDEQPEHFVTIAELRVLVPFCQRTLYALVKRGAIPSIRLPGSRRLLFDLTSVRSALLRHQRERAV